MARSAPSRSGSARRRCGTCSPRSAWRWSRSRCAGSPSTAGWRRGVYAKDVILEIIRRLGVKGGAGFAYEYAGDAVERMSMDERMTICNMSIEGGARVGYVNPDQTTFDYLRGRRIAPQGDGFERAVGVVDVDRVGRGRELRRPCRDRRRRHPADGHLGHQPRPVGGDRRAGCRRTPIGEALAFMGFRAGQPMKGTKIDVAFVGSCTNARLVGFA